MGLNSKIIEAKVMHDRRIPKRNRFRYGIFTFQIDLDELDLLNQSFRLIGRNNRRLFAFRDADHMDFGKAGIKENFLEYVSRAGVKEKVGRVTLVTNLRILGYTFNPVSFYFAEDEFGRPLCSVAEVGNTFGEMKHYFLGKETLDARGFRRQEGKFFYVSPFISLDSVFDFRLNPPADDRLNIRIDALEKGETIMMTTYTGKARRLTDLGLLWMFFKYPFVTFKVISLIHWQALKLYLNKIPFIRKNENIDLQIGVHLGKR
ncbi:PF07103 family protein [Leptospira broomii serovar Hurstbridge str. 5399]|uniref:PF07103 family protein n=1 Tax=Leptospira broomii serovar Hurstbridge str. 5399 TaxID=1049789 RepID=T0FFG3_9LEPT|nr:DUF1365 domain-containing protein [Leptospira broomii]EQA46596.1 PF07103 family protein [Leptospira broomii serovar Hurstbridge str. 5399]